MKYILLSSLKWIFLWYVWYVVVCVWICHSHTDEVWTNSTSGSVQLPWEINIIHKENLGICQVFFSHFYISSIIWLFHLWFDLWQFLWYLCVLNKSSTLHVRILFQTSFVLNIFTQEPFNDSHWFDLFPTGYSVPHARQTQRVHVLNDDEWSLF